MPTPEEMAALLAGDNSSSDPKALLQKRGSPYFVPPVAETAGHMIAPNLMDYYKHPQGLEPKVLPSGKISAPDPRMGGVGSDVSNLLTAPLGLAAPELMGEKGASAASGLLKKLGAHAAEGSRVTDMMGSAASMGSALSPTSAGAADSSIRPVISPEEQKQIDDLNFQLEGLNKKRATVVSRAGGPKTAAVAAGGIDTQISGINDAIQRIRDTVLKRQTDFDTRQSEAAKATAPISVRNPDAMNTARAAALLSSPLVGGLLGYKGFHPVSRALAGGVEGMAPNFGSNVMDYATGGEARKSALDNFNNPDWWKWAVGGESALGALGAHTGGHIGEALRTPTPGSKPARALPQRGPKGQFIKGNP